MSTHICPKCGADQFTWSIDSEDSVLTTWACSNCWYTAYEDESLERVCNLCKNKFESRLVDDDTEYWWCCKCERDKRNELTL